MKFLVYYTRIQEWDEEVEVPEDLLVFNDDDHMDRGLTPNSRAKVAAFLYDHGSESKVVPVMDKIEVENELI